MSNKVSIQQCKSDIEKDLYAGEIEKAANKLLLCKEHFGDRSEMDDCVNLVEKTKRIIQELSYKEKEIQNKLEKDQFLLATLTLKGYLSVIGSQDSLLHQDARQILGRLLDALRPLETGGDIFALVTSDFKGYKDQKDQCFNLAREKLEQLRSMDVNWWQERAAGHAEMYINYFHSRALYGVTESLLKFEMLVYAYVVARENRSRFPKDPKIRKSLTGVTQKLNGLLMGKVKELYETHKKLQVLTGEIDEDLTLDVIDISARLDQIATEAPDFTEQKYFIKAKGSLRKVQSDITAHQNLVVLIQKLSPKNGTENVAALCSLLDEMETLEFDFSRFDGLNKRYHGLKKNIENLLCIETINVLNKFVEYATRCIDLDLGRSDLEFVNATEIYHQLLDETYQRGLLLAKNNKRYERSLKKYRTVEANFKKKYDI